MIPKTLKPYEKFIADFSPKEFGDPHFIELTPGYKWGFGYHVASFNTIKECQAALRNVEKCTCNECKAILNAIKS